MLVNGIWQENWQPVHNKDEKGRFIRQTSSFRNWITRDGSLGITGEGVLKLRRIDITCTLLTFALGQVEH